MLDSIFYMNNPPRKKSSYKNQDGAVLLNEVDSVCKFNDFLLYKTSKKITNCSVNLFAIM